jgi:hypothetical protein
MKRSGSRLPDGASHSRKVRAERRRLLRQSARGDRSAYLGLVENYYHLVDEYIALSGWTEPSARRSRLLDLFEEAWTRSSYAWRLSDFERLLAEGLVAIGTGPQPEGEALPLANLENLSGEGVPTLRSALIRATRELSLEERFILVAHELEDWSLRWAGLALRLSEAATQDLLLRMRVKLCGMDIEQLAGPEFECLKALSSKLGTRLGAREQARLCERMNAHPALLDFKATWLELRCNLVETRQDYRAASEATRAGTLTSLFKRITLAELRRPQLFEQALNRVKFVRYPEVGVG